VFKGSWNKGPTGGWRPSPKQAPRAEVERMLGLYRDKYADFTVKHFHVQMVKRHGYKLGYTVIKLTLHTAGLLKPARGRSPHREKCQPRPLPGMVLHQDGWHHVWVAGRPPMGLMVTHRLDVGRCARWLRRMACSMRSTPTRRPLFPHPESNETVSRSQRRALAQLGIEHIASYSPQLTAAQAATP
jgi:hypothetical protein